jgi:hypothetical protein
MPTKEQVRKFMQERQKQKTPPPTPEEIRRMLGPVPTTKR